MYPLFTNKNFTEGLRLIFLFSLVIYLYDLFITGKTIGAFDAQWYQYLLHDAILQIDHGFFPPYVGQSAFYYFGTPTIRAPYYLLLGQFLHLLTLGKLNSIYIQHLIVLVSALAATFLTYFLLINLAPKLRWHAFILAVLYITCPGVIGLIYRCDMYYSFMTLPFVPLFVYGLIQTYRNGNKFSYILTAIALSFLWLAHPPIALWSTLFGCLFFLVRFVFTRQGLVGLFFILFMVAIFNLWQFVGVFQFQMDPSAIIPSVHQYILHNTVDYLKAAIPGVFLPLGWSTNGTTPFLQLGYSLWLILATVILLSYKFLKHLGLTLLSVISSMLLLLYPLPHIGNFLWSLIPPSVLITTNLWPMQRFYIILSVFTIFLGILTFEKINFSSLKIKLFFNAAFFLILVYAVYQAHYFKKPENISIDESNSWLNSNNIVFIPYGTRATSSTFMGTYDPKLKDRVLDSKFLPITTYDNEDVMINKCIVNSKRYKNISLSPVIKKIPTDVPIKLNQIPLSLMKIKIEPQKNYFFCIYSLLENVEIDYQMSGQAYLLKRLNITPKNKKPLAFPIYSQDAALKNLTLQISRAAYVLPNNAQAKMKIQSIGVVNYNLDQLPIRIESVFPYKANLTTNTDDTYLEVFKEYYPGYKALVNGKVAKVLESQNKLIMIPLKKKGLNHVELYYRGTFLMRISFYISTAAWLIILLYGLKHLFLSRRIFFAKGREVNEFDRNKQCN